MLNKYDLIPGIDIHEALASHVDLGNRLRDLIEGDNDVRLDADEVSSEVHCVLGKWIHGRATLRYARLPEFAALRDAHAEFHVCAGNALKVLREGNTAAARALQNGALRSAVDGFRGALAGFCTAAAQFTNAGREALAAAGAKITRAIVARRAFWIVASALGAAAALRVLGTESMAAARALPFGMPDLLAMLAVAGPGLYFLIVRPLLTAREHLAQAEVDLQIATAAIETLPPMLITDSNSMIVKVNRAFCEVTGYSADEVIGKTPKLLRSHKHDAAFFAEMWGTIARTGTWHGANWNRRKDGGEFLADLYIHALRGEAGEPIAYVSRFTDLTEQRVGMLANETPEAPAKTRTEFLTYMGHQLRTPMNAMLGYTDLALNEAPAGTMRGYLEQVRDAGRKLLGRIDDVLDLSRIEAGNLTLERVEFDLKAVCNVAFRTAVIAGTARGIELESSIDNGIPGKVLGDPTRTAQILDILLANAVRYNDQGKVSLAVTLHRLGPDMANIGIMVRDTGIGMDAAQVSKLFAPFAGAERPVSRHEGGAGLGLVIAKSLIEQMGGTLAVESAPGKGSSFHAVLSFRLPGETQPATGDTARTIDVGWASIETGRYAGKRVLVAEDDEDSQGLIRTVMEKFGFEVDIAENGQEAVRRLKGAERAYDLVLMDIRMPEMGGLEATRIIRERHPMQVLPIVALSANAFDEDRQQSLNAGMNEHLVKPLEVGRLDRVLKIVLG